MKQILQDLSKGSTYIENAPAPVVTKNTLLIQTEASLVSAGTERMLVDFGRSSLLQKAKQQPEKVKQVIEKSRTDGIASTIETVRSKLNQPISLGYCNVGIVLEVGSKVFDFQVGDRVLSNGPHANIVRVPANLCAKVPDGVEAYTATFGVVGAIALQGIRIANPSLGESFVVTGVGLIGLLAVQLLRAQGCRVLAIDFDEAKLDLARSFGAEICNLARKECPVSAGESFSRGRGVDGVLVTASTSSSNPISQAAQMSRKRGRIVLVGVTGLELNRSDFYKKELSFQVSCSYGPGRYDEEYEGKGHDYPFGYVRWTAQRNFEAFLDMLGSGQIDVSKLVTRRIPFEDAPKAYDFLLTDNSVLGLILEYPGLADIDLKRTVALPLEKSAGARHTNLGKTCAFIGAGNYSSRVLMPSFRKAGAVVKTVITSSGISAVIHGKANESNFASTDLKATLADDSIKAIVIATRHNSHSSLVLEALEAGKHVFVEKPLCLKLGELNEIESAYQKLVESKREAPVLMVGFNRRFSPHASKISKLLDSVAEPKSFVMTVNGGHIPPDHWTQDLEIGGGRIIGEACHFIDLLRFLSGSAMISHEIVYMDSKSKDTAIINLKFEDGSIGSIQYLSNGSKSFPKERLEIFVQGRIIQLDNFRKLRGFGWPGFSKMNLWRQDKGQYRCAQAFLDAIGGKAPDPIPTEEVFEVSRVSMELASVNI